MWSLLSRFVPVLLASSSSTPSASDLIITSPAFLRQVYDDLERPGSVHKQVSPTLRFSYVSPPCVCPINGTTSTWNNHHHQLFQEEEEEEDDIDATSTTRTRRDNNDSAKKKKKPVAIYLPGLDGYGISACLNQFDDLANAFEFWRLTVLPDDRSSFSKVVQTVEEFVLEEFEGRDVVLIGESCGGVFASAAAWRLQQQETNDPLLKGLVLVNPATSFKESPWEQLVPLLTSLRHLETDNELREDRLLTPYSVVGSLLLATTIPDIGQIRRIGDALLNNLPGPKFGLESLQQILDASLAGFREMGFRLPPDALEHRVANWLNVGTPHVNSRLSELQVPTLVVVGEEDRLLPSAAHADMLLGALPNGEKLSVRGRGHFVLDENVNLTEAILYSKIDPLYWKDKKKAYDSILDWKLPVPELREAIEKTVKPMRVVHSPVFFSTDARGKRWRGLSKLPVDTDGPLLFVANHQFAGSDMRMFQAELFEERGLFPRGLAHPLLFEMSKDRPSELAGRVPGIRDFPQLFNADFMQFGAIKVSPRNYFRLMQSGQDGLLFPGGAKEAMSGRTDYPLIWPDKIDFVRTAARFNATIIPLSAVGMIDGVNVIAEPQDIMKVPFIGDRLRNLSSNVGPARYDEQVGDEPVGIPLAVPSLPQRNYFIFGKPISLKDVDPKDKDACLEAYHMAQSQVRQGIDDLLRAREKDPFKDTPRRLAYERVFGKQAPTFSVSEIN